MIEMRFDLLLCNSDFRDFFLFETFQSLCSQARKAGLPLIGTLRSKKEGGRFPGNDTELIRSICLMIPFVDFVDIEIRLNSKNIRKCTLCAKKHSIPVILSSHTQKSLKPKTFKKRIRKASYYTPFLIKAASRVQSYSEGLSFLKRSSLIVSGMHFSYNPEFCFIPVGEHASPLRKIAPDYGSSFLYGSVTKPAAPGQISVSELKKNL